MFRDKYKDENYFQKSMILISKHLKGEKGKNIKNVFYHNTSINIIYLSLLMLKNYYELIMLLEIH